MRISIHLVDDLLAEAAGLSGLKTKKALVHEMHRVFAASKKRTSLLDLIGKIQFAPGYARKAVRR